MNIPRAWRNRLLQWAEKRMACTPSKVIGIDYLCRWHVIPRNPLFNIYLHEFTGSESGTGAFGAAGRAGATGKSSPTRATADRPVAGVIKRYNERTRRWKQDGLLQQPSSSRVAAS